MTATTTALNEPPHDLEDRWLELWRQLRDKLDERGRWSPTTSANLTRYVRCVRSAEVHQAAADAEPYVEGSTGQKRAHPGAKLARDAQAEAQELAKDLRLRDLRWSE